MKFDLKKAQAGDPVQIFKELVTLDDVFAGEECLWNDLDAHFIGKDIHGDIIYQINEKRDNAYAHIRSVNPEFLRMKPKYKTLWFRTYMYGNGFPGVIVRDSKEEILDLKLSNSMYWIDEPWSKEIPENNNEYTC